MSESLASTVCRTLDPRCCLSLLLLVHRVTAVFTLSGIIGCLVEDLNSELHGVKLQNSFSAVVYFSLGWFLHTNISNL